MKTHANAILIATLACGFGCSSAAPERPPGEGGAAGALSSGGTPGVAGAPGVGGMLTGAAGERITIPVAGAANGGAASCGVQEYNRERKPAEVILVLDRSASMQDEPSGGNMPKWDMTIPAIKNVIQTTNGGISWGLKLYPESQDTDSCAPETIVPTIHVPIAAANAGAVVGAIDATTPEGDGTPTGDAIKFALAHLRERATANDNPKYILLATDGDPSCPSGGDAGVAYAVQYIEEALMAGFPTFVVGVDTAKESSIENLNEMAEAGGRPRPRTNPNPLAPHTSFYLTSSQAALEEALRSITGELASCIFDLNPPPPVPENIAVDFSGSRTERDPTRMNGWEYTKDDYTQLQVYGSWCERIKNEAMNVVNIKYGCPNVPIPVPR